MPLIGMFFAADSDGCDVWPIGPFGTREDALEEALVNYPGSVVFTGVGVEAKGLAGDLGDRVVAIVAERMLDGVGDLAENWLSGLRREATADLDAALEAAFLLWIDRHSLRPNFCRISDIRRHEAPGESPE